MNPVLDWGIDINLLFQSLGAALEAPMQAISFLGIRAVLSVRAPGDLLVHQCHAGSAPGIDADGQHQPE